MDKNTTVYTYIDVLAAFKDKSSPEEALTIKGFFKGTGADNQILGMRMKDVFETAKTYSKLPLAEIGRLLDDLIDFLDENVSHMDRKTLRYAVEKLEPELKSKYTGRA